MDKKDDKVIPTLDDVIKPGAVETTMIGDLGDLDDDFDITDISLSADASLDDDSFAAEFNSIALNNNAVPHSNGATQTLPDREKVNGFHQEANTRLNNKLDDIADQIVAERFPAESDFALESTPPAPVRKTKAKTSPAAVKTQTQEVKKQAAKVSAKPAPVVKAELEISQIVDDITRQLMPEIEWKIRTRLRDMLEEHFPDRD